MQTKDSSVEGIMTDIIVEQLNVSREKVTREAKFEKDLGADSLDFWELILAFEETFGIEIPDKIAHEIRTVGEALNCVNHFLMGKIQAS